MEIKIGVQNVAREVVLESEQSPDEVVSLVEGALSSGSLLRLTDAKGRTVLVPGSEIGYLELGAPEKRGVGFGSL